MRQGLSLPVATSVEGVSRRRGPGRSRTRRAPGRVRLIVGCDVAQALSLVDDHQSVAYHPEQIDARADSVAEHPLARRHRRTIGTAILVYGSSVVAVAARLGQPVAGTAYDSLVRSQWRWIRAARRVAGSGRG
jgi:hypothetical protein